jgi:hypothetical protein
LVSRAFLSWAAWAQCTRVGRHAAFHLTFHHPILTETATAKTKGVDQGVALDPEMDHEYQVVVGQGVGKAL